MSEENVEVVRRVFGASAQRDAETVFSLFDPEAEWDNSQGPFKDLIGAGVYRGHGRRSPYGDGRARSLWRGLVELQRETTLLREEGAAYRYLVHRSAGAEPAGLTADEPHLLVLGQVELGRDPGHAPLQLQLVAPRGDLMAYLLLGAQPADLLAVDLGEDAEKASLLRPPDGDRRHRFSFVTLIQAQ